MPRLVSGPSLKQILINDWVLYDNIDNSVSQRFGKPTKSGRDIWYWYVIPVMHSCFDNHINITFFDVSKLLNCS